MKIRIRLFLFLSALLVLGAYPEASDARRNRQSSARAKSKKKANKKPDAETQLDEDPYEAEGKAKSDEETVEPDSQENIEETERISKSGSGEGSLRRSGRMEFDERLVKGQAAKSGAVYLFKRTPRRLPGLVPMRRSYRRRIVEPVLGERELKPALFSTEATSPLKADKKKSARQPTDQENAAALKQNEKSSGQDAKKEKKVSRRKLRLGGKK